MVKKVLVVIGDCIETNTSANICHLAYIKGFLQLGYQVTLISSDNSFYTKDISLAIPKEVKHVKIDGMSIYEKISIKLKSKNDRKTSPDSISEAGPKSGKITRLCNVISYLKKHVLSLYGVHGVYATFIRKARHINLDDEFDCIVSISTPVTSHVVAYNLIKAEQIKGYRWFQIWEDPWYADVYGCNKKDEIFQEERRILSLAESVCYVSPLTLKYQKQFFNESSEKMFWKPLPYLESNVSYPRDNRNVEDKGIREGMKRISLGYFGNYTPSGRNISHLYNTINNYSNYKLIICGEPHNLLSSTENVSISPRQNLEVIRDLENTVDILVVLCNKSGGQIPGKIYQYSTTRKPILVILDGSMEEKDTILSTFKPYARYEFCENNPISINRSIERIKYKIENGFIWDPVLDFTPSNIVKSIVD